MTGGRRLAILFHEPHVLGAGVSLLRVLPRLTALGWDPTGWFPGPGPLVDAAAAHLSAQASHPRPIALSVRGWSRPPGIGSRLRSTPGYLGALRNWLRNVRPDVVHANSLVMLPEAAVARALGLPVVLHVHELPAPTPKRDLTLRWACRVADVLVGVSVAVGEMLGERAGRTPVLVVHNGVPEVSLSRPRTDESVVGCVGHVSRTKGTDVFLRAAALALRSRPDLRFEHIGPSRLWGDDDFDRYVESLAAAPELAAALTMRGRRPAEEGLERWQIVAFPSRQDAFPLATLEAMSAGLPVIACAVGGIPEQIVHGESGLLIPPDDPAALAEAVVRLHDDPALRARLARNASERVRARFTLDRQAEGLGRAYGLAAGYNLGRSG